MSRHALIGALLAAALLGPAAARDRRDGDNLLRNGAFAKNLKGWTLSKPKAKAALDGRAAKVTLADGEVLLMSEPVAIDPREPYFVEALVRTKDADDATLDVLEWDGKRVLPPRPAPVARDVGMGTPWSRMRGSKGWTRLQYTVTPNLWQDATRAARIALRVKAKGRPATAWMRQVFFAQGIDLDYLDPSGWEQQPGTPEARASFRKRHILFYAPMEADRVPAAFAEGEWRPVRASGYDLVPGRKGKALQFRKSGGYLVYSAPRNFQSGRGTVAFWLKRGKGLEYFLTVSPSDGTFYGQMVRIVQRNPKGPMSIFLASPGDGKHGAKRIKVAPPPPGRWAHMAFCWDKRFGVKFYVDGEVKYSTWGKEAWDHDAVPGGMHIGHGFGKNDGKQRAGSAYDEFYVFDVALTTAEIAALMRDELADVNGEPGGEKRLTHLADAAGLRPSPDLPVVTRDGAAVFRVVQPVDAMRFYGKGKMRQMDGDPSTYAGGETDYVFDRPSRITHITMLSTGKGVRAEAWDGAAYDAKRARKLAEFGPGVVTRRVSDGSPVAKLRIAAPKGASVCEFQAMEVGGHSPRISGIGYPLGGLRDPSHFGRLDVPPGRGLNTYCTRYGFARFPFSLAWEISARYPRGERLLVCPGSGDSQFGTRLPPPSVVRVPPMTPLSLLTSPASRGPEMRWLKRELARHDASSGKPAPAKAPKAVVYEGDDDVPVRAVEFWLKLENAKLPDVWRVTIEDPADQRRPVFQWPLTIEPGSDFVRFVVDIRDLFIPAGERLWARIESRNGFTLKLGVSALMLRTGSRKEVLREFLVDKLRYCRHAYSLRAEGHFWDGARKNTYRARRAFMPLTYQKVFTHLRHFRRYKKDDDIAETLWSRITLRPRDVKLDVAGLNGVPKWAVYQCAVLKGANRIARWWIDNKQRPDGGMGGGLGDDVEMTVRSWPYLSLITGDRKVTAGLKRLADGVWTSGILRDGYSAKARDVEHASEPSAFSQPHMMAVLYGHPEYVERNMRGISHMGEWSKIATNGKRHIQGWAFGAGPIRSRGRNRVDVPCNGRAVLAGNWVAWYNRHPLVMKWMTEYADAWLTAAAKAEKGKPKWALPNEICAETGEIYRYSLRHPKSVYGGYTHEMLSVLLGVSELTGDKRFLKPFSVHGGARFLPQLANRDPSGPWIGLAREMVKKRYTFRYTGIGPVGQAACLDWRAGGKVDPLEHYLRESAKWYANNMYLMTVAEPSTDRVYAPGMDAVSCMALGYWVGARNGFPQIACSFDNAGYETGVMIVRGDDTRLKVMLCNLRRREAKVTLRTWRLKPGRYELRLGPDANNDGRIDRATVTREVTIAERRRNPVPLVLPPRRLVIAELRLVKPLPDPGLACADLAVSPEDLKLSKDRRTLTVRVHNVGVKPVGPFTVSVRDGDAALATARVEGLDWPKDLRPRVAEVMLKSPRPIPREATVLLQVEKKTPEITRMNNVVVIE